MTVMFRIGRDSVFAIMALSLFLMIACSGTRYFVPPPEIPDDRQNIPEPEERDYNYVSDGFDQQFSNQLEQSFDLSRQFRHLAGKPKQALNVDAFDEVGNSSWFTNRNAQMRMTIEGITVGPNISGGPDTTGEWIVTRAKAEGITPGFHIKDKHGNRYVIKFDPQGYAELATGAEVISTLIFYAAGFHTPENYLTIFNPDILVVGEKVRVKDAFGRKRYMTDGDLRELISRIQSLPDGRIRALASRYIPGIPKGPFSYEGIRKDDPNDFIPHEHRRELRGLRVMSAWLNHADTKSGNSFDSYITEDGKSYIRHYLIDFGSTLGSSPRGPCEPQTGHENQVDPHVIGANIFTLGFDVRAWEEIPSPVEYPSIGLFEYELFDPYGYKFSTPNAAFENCTSRDGYWGAKLVMSFTDEQLAAIVRQAQYSNPDAEAYLLDVLKKRRDKTGRYWFERVNPLDNFRFEIINDKQWLCFDDLMIETGLEQEGYSRYRCNIFSGDKAPQTVLDLGMEKCVNVTDLGSGSNPGAIGNPEFKQKIIEIETFNELDQKWSKGLKVYLDYSSDQIKILGIEREE